MRHADRWRNSTAQHRGGAARALLNLLLAFIPFASAGAVAPGIALQDPASAATSLPNRISLQNSPARRLRVAVTEMFDAEARLSDGPDVLPWFYTTIVPWFGHYREQYEERVGSHGMLGTS